MAENNHDDKVRLHWENAILRSKSLKVLLRCAITNVSFASERVAPPPPSAAFIGCVSLEISG